MLKLKFKNIAFLMICIYTVGALGHLHADLKPYFLILTPYNLVLTLAVYLVLNTIKLKDIPLLSIIFTIGFFIEVIGVKTGLLFGVYHYGDSLGLKWLNVPLVMGINWILLSLIGFGLVNKYFTNLIVKSSLAALLIVLLDILIEPIAIQLDYWTWQNNEIPLQNYVMWFIVSFSIQVIINYSKIKIDFKSSLLMLALQLLFFSLLNLAL